MSTAGYSGTPLTKKLGIHEGSTVLVVRGPDDLHDLLAPLPPGVVFRSRVGKGGIDVVLLFVTRRTQLESKVDALGAAVRPSGALWVAWPKRASKVATDMTEDVVRDVALPLGLVDNKVCAIDATWSGLRLVWRRELR